MSMQLKISIHRIIRKMKRKQTADLCKDALVTTVTTGEDGKAVADNLPLGSYYVVEKTAPEGFVLNHDRSDVAFVYADQDTPVIEQEVTVGDDRQKVVIQVENRMQKWCNRSRSCLWYL